MKEIDTKNNLERGEYAIGLMKNSSKKIKILELGTGGGELFLKLNETGFKNIVGLDILPNKELLNRGFIIKKHDLNKGLPFKNNSFDVVIALEVLEHLFNPYDMMKEIRRVLKTGGYALISMPNSASIFSRIGQLYEKRPKKLDIYWHHFQPSITSIKNLVKTELNIEKEIYISSFRRLSLLNPLLKSLIKINKEAFSGDFLVKAVKK